MSTDEKTMINRVLDLQSLRVRHVSIPMATAITISAATPMTQVLALCRDKNLTRLPVIHPTGRILGVINMERVLYLEDLDLNKRAQDYAQPPLFLPEELRLEEALNRMQHTGGRMAVVMGRGHEETGIITLQDILKVIFGEVTL